MKKLIKSNNSGIWTLRKTTKKCTIYGHEMRHVLCIFSVEFKAAFINKFLSCLGNKKNCNRI